MKSFVPLILCTLKMNAQQLLLFDITNFELVLKGSDTDEPTHKAEVPVNNPNRIEKGAARLQRCSNTHLW